MENLLRYNVSNQNLFRETSCINRVPLLLVSKISDGRGDVEEIPLSDSRTVWNDQKISNASHVKVLIITGYAINEDIGWAKYH